MMKMIHRLWMAAMLVPLAAMAQEKKFQIDGTLNDVNPRPARILLFYPYRGENIMDSVDVKGNKYHFEGEIETPLRVDISARYKETPPANAQPEILSLFIEPADITISSNNTFTNATVTGSASNDEYNKLKAAGKVYEDKVAPLYQQFDQYSKDKNTAGMEQVRKQVTAIQKQMVNDVYGNYIKNNPGSPIALFALQQYTGPIVKNSSETEKLFNTLPESLRNSSDGQKFESLIRFSKMTEVGKAAPDFIQNDTSGNPIALSSYRGKYLLLHFWGAFAIDSRRENKKLVPIYQKYHAKGFNILGVSLDEAKPDGSGKAKWLNAIRRDSLPWPQVSDLQFWNNAAAKKYGVTIVPESFLIDPQGKIVARFLTPEELDAKLATLLK